MHISVSRGPDGHHLVSASATLHMPARRAFELHTRRDNARVFRDVGEYTTWDARGGDIEAEYWVGWKLWKMPMRVSMRPDPTANSVAFEARAPAMRSLGAWKFDALDDASCVARLDQRVTLNLPFLPQSILTDRVRRAFEDMEREAIQEKSAA